MRAAAQSFRANPAFKTEDAIMELGTGEALVSFLDEEGRPSVVENAKVLPLQCLMAAPEQRYVDVVLAEQAELMDKYGQAVDRSSAFEQLAEAAQKEAEAAELAAEREALEKEKAQLAKERERQEKAAAKKKSGSSRMTPTERAVGNMASTIGREVGRQLIRGIFGSLKR